MSTSGSINFQGLGSGIDFSKIVTDLKKGEEIPKKQMEGWYKDWERRYEGFEKLLEGFKTFEEALKGLDSVGKIIEKKVNTSEEDIATAKATADAQNGTTSITVTKLATNAIVSFDGRFSKDTVVTQPSTTPQLEDFTYEYKGKTHTIKIPTGTTMDELVKKINSDPHNPGVSASLLKSGEQYIFQLQGDDTGEDSTLTFDPVNNSGLVGFDTHKTRVAQDAEFYLNGWEENSMKSASNTLTEVVEGLEITIIAVGDADLTVTQSTEGIKEKVEEFVEATNKLLMLFAALTRIDDDDLITDTDTQTDMENSDDTKIEVNENTLYNQQGGLLTGNYGIQMISSQFKAILSSSFEGSSIFDPATGYGDPFRSLAVIGIITDDDQSSDTFGELIFYERDDDVSAEIEPATQANLVFNQLLQRDDPVIAVTDPPSKVDFTYTYKGKEHTLKVDSGSTGSKLCEAIRDDPENPGVTAYFSGYTDASGSGYKFSLKGDGKGEDADVEFDINQPNVLLGDYTKIEPKDAIMDPFRTLDEILAEDALAVANILAGDKTSTSSPNFSYNSKLDSTESGLYDVSYDVDANNVISNVMIGGLPAKNDPNSLENNWTAIGEGGANGLSITIHTSTASESVKGTVGIQRGKTKELLEFLEEQTRENEVSLATPGSTYEKGTLIILMDNYETIMENIQKKIDRETERVIRWEAQQRAHYSRLDTLLMQYNNQMSSNTDQLAKLNTINWGVPL